MEYQQPGVRWEGDAPDFTREDELAITVFNHIENGFGGLDWKGFEIVTEMLGIDDLEGLIHRLLVIKSFRPESERKDNAMNPHDTAGLL